MNSLKNDQSIKDFVHMNRNQFNGCDMQTQVGDESMLPDFPANAYLFCDETKVEALEPGKAYVFCLRTHPHYTHVFKRFDGIIDGAIQVSAINPAYSPFEPIPVVDLIDVWSIKWRCIADK